MSLETIKKKIKEAGEKEAEAIMNAGEKEISALQEEEASKVKVMAEEAENALGQKRAQILAEARIRADFSRRNFLLGKKRELIDEVFSAVLKNLASLHAEKKQKLLKQYLEETKQELGPHARLPLPAGEANGGQAKIFACSADREIIEKLLSQYAGFTLAQKAINATGGFRAASAQIELDHTFDSLIAEKREALESAVARILFQQ